MLVKNLLKILNKSHRIIEFSKRSSLLPEQIVEDDNYLTILRENNNIQNSNRSIILDSRNYLDAITKNSCDIIILNSSGIRELKALQNTHTAIYFFQRLTLFNLIFAIYFLAKIIVSKHQKFYGLFSFRNGKNIYFYVGVKRNEQPERRIRHYLSPLVKIEDFFQFLREQNIKYSLLRWFDDLPEVKSNEDIDLLVDDDALEKLHSLIDVRPGTIPFDIYSKTGKPGSDFQSMPYYILSLAEKALNETILFKNKYKAPTQENYFYLLAYHSVFHKGEDSGLLSKKFDININDKPDHDYLSYLKRIASEVNLYVQDFTLEGLHALLESKGFAPPIDTLYKLSINNQYLKSYLKDYHINSEYPTKFKGLVCFVAREKIIENGLLDDLKKYIQKEGFTILKVKKLEDLYKINFTKKVRGGNWNQGPWPMSGGFPAVIIVALDVYPVDPIPDDYDKHPGITNKRIKNKTEIRDFINLCLSDESKWFNGVHSSDNEIQAVEYLTLAGLDENEIYEEILNYRQAFITKYFVLKVLSQYSKRAKVELIDFNGVKAVKKTFKPMCEKFLANEIEAYTIFRGVLPIPKLLETGDNYIITSYIEGSRPLGNRISIKILKKCLKILRHLYDEGYSLLDFKPGNFLIDNNKNIYLIDFEFLYKYDVKPAFINCYDLLGIPENLDKSIIPNNHISRGTKQFDALWYRFTGINYEELSQLNSFTIKLKSITRYYNTRAKNILFKINRVGERIIKTFYRYLP